MDGKTEITRVVSLLRSLLRSELQDCAQAISGGNLQRAKLEISDAAEKLKRAINVLNGLR